MTRQTRVEVSHDTWLILRNKQTELINKSESNISMKELADFVFQAVIEDIHLEFRNGRWCLRITPYEYMFKTLSKEPKNVEGLKNEKKEEEIDSFFKDVQGMDKTTVLLRCTKCNKLVGIINTVDNVTKLIKNHNKCSGDNFVMVNDHECSVEELKKLQVEVDASDVIIHKET